MKSLEYAFTDSEILQRALTHSSYAHENGLSSSECNERLEFLGDAVLELTISEYLYHENGNLSEGELTKLRASLVCESSLAALARTLEIGSYLRLGRGEALSGGADRDSLLADALEAVIGAVFLDGGIDNARALIRRLFTSVIKKQSVSDGKSLLQEIIQKNSREPIIYTIINETGPAHNKEFTAAVSHQGRLLGTGVGKNKKEAEQNAAKVALQKM